MGARKHYNAEDRKDAMQSIYIARLNNCPTSPRKMNLVAELIRGKNVYEALNILHFNPKHPSKNLEKLLRSAISNFEQKSGERAEDNNLFVKEVRVDGGPILKRFRPAPQGRAYRIRKRSNHVLLTVDKRLEIIPETTESEATEVEEPTIPEVAETAAQEITDTTASEVEETKEQEAEEPNNEESNPNTNE